MCSRNIQTIFCSTTIGKDVNTIGFLWFKNEAEETFSVCRHELTQNSYCEKFVNTGRRMIYVSQFCYYFDLELCWHNYCAMLIAIIMTLECYIVSNLRWSTIISKLEKSLNNIFSSLKHIINFHIVQISQMKYLNTLINIITCHR